MSYFEIESRYHRLIDALEWAHDPAHIQRSLARLQSEDPIAFNQIEQAHEQALADLGGAQ